MSIRFSPRNEILGISLSISRQSPLPQVLSNQKGEGKASVSLLHVIGYIYGLPLCWNLMYCCKINLGSISRAGIELSLRNAWVLFFSYTVRNDDCWYIHSPRSSWELNAFESGRRRSR